MTDTETGAFVSALYPGRVWHRRYRPRDHVLRYDILMMLLDLGELERLDRAFRWFSVGRFNLIGFSPRRHGDGTATPLPVQTARTLTAAGLPAGGAVRMLCMPRMLGQAFNPLTVYFCHAPALEGEEGALIALIYEVNNTFGQRHSYLLPVTTEPAGSPGDPVRHGCAKRFFVSPFMDMDLAYRFKIRPPGDGGEGEPLAVEIEVDDAEGLMLTAAFAGQRTALSDRALLAAALAHPFQMLKVVGGIHWEALKIWLKGVRLRARPAPPPHPISLPGAGPA